jgi:hypothetical protein
MYRLTSYAVLPGEAAGKTPPQSVLDYLARVMPLMNVVEEPGECIRLETAKVRR